MYGCMVHPINTDRGKRDFYETVIICILGGHRLPIKLSLYKGNNQKKKRTMTYEEFKELALNPPRRDMETIFKVVVYSVNERVYSRRSHYPKFELSHRTIGYYHSVDDSEKLFLR